MRYWDFEEDVDEAVQAGLLVLGGLVREARRHRNLTQRELAWASTLTQSTISKLENGRLRGMRLRTLAAVIGVLRTSQPRDEHRRRARVHQRLPAERRS
jgi:DNA-binding Xre family transcriptional regulator